MVSCDEPIYFEDIGVWTSMYLLNEIWDWKCSWFQSKFIYYFLIITHPSQPWQRTRPSDRTIILLTFFRWNIATRWSDLDFKRSHRFRATFFLPRRVLQHDLVLVAVLEATFDRAIKLRVCWLRQRDSPEIKIPAGVWANSSCGFFCLAIVEWEVFMKKITLAGEKCESSL